VGLPPCVDSITIYAGQTAAATAGLIHPLIGKMAAADIARRPRHEW
jgi:hypothetical protein